jgi:glycosyltransferase involved in cell wall biosynthesis
MYSIRGAIQSVLNQTYRDFEIIVVDDGSTDDTEKTVKSLKDERIRYIRHDKNRGAAAARNTGIKAARGEYIAFQDSDDEWLPEKLEKQMEVFRNATPEVGVVYTGFWRIKSDAKEYIPSDRISRKEGNIHKELLKGNFVSGVSAVARRDCFEKAGLFDESLPRFQDWELFIRFSNYCKFKYIDQPLLLAYLGPGNISTNNKAFQRALEIILTKHFEEFSEHGKLLAKYYFNLGFLLYFDGARVRGLSYLMKAAGLDPSLIRTMFSGFARGRALRIKIIFSKTSRYLHRS